MANEIHPGGRSESHRSRESANKVPNGHNGNGIDIDRVKEAAQSLRDYSRQAGEYVRANPMASLGIAAACGFVLAWTFRRD